jgi:hypothetical protein
MGAASEEIRTQAEAIYARHLAAADPRMEHMPAPGDHPDELLALARYLNTDDPMSADIPEALAIVVHLYTVLDRYQLALLHAGQRHNLPLSAMASAIGVRARQGVEARIIRLEAAAAGRVRIESRERAARAGDLDAGRWLHRRRERIRRAARAVLSGMAGRSWWSENAADWAEDLELVLRLPDPSTGEMIVYLSLLAQDWRRCPGAPESSAIAEVLALADGWDSVAPVVAARDPVGLRPGQGG